MTLKNGDIPTADAFNQVIVDAQAAGAAAVAHVYPATYSVAPTTRPDGSPIQNGDRYTNSTDGLEYICIAGAWTSGASQAQAAAASATAAAAARDSVNSTGKVFADTTTGLAGTTSGQTFAVLDASLQFWIVYKNNAGTATEVARNYTKAYIDAAFSAQPTDPAYVPLVHDQADNVAVWLAAGMLDAMGFGPSLKAALAVYLAANYLQALAVDNGSVPLFVDAADNVPVWLSNGLLDAFGLGPTLTAAVISLGAGKYAPLAGPTSSSRCISTDGRSLYGWRSKLAKIARGTTLAQARIIVAGDSWGEKIAIPQQLANILYANNGGRSGDGWINLFDGTPLNGATLGSTNWTKYDASDNVAPTLGCGWDGKAYSTTGTTATWTTAGVYTTNFDIYYQKNTGSFRYNVDGGAWTTVAGDGSMGLGKVSISGLTDGVAHTFNIDTSVNNGGGTVVLYGTRATRPAAAGIELLKGGNGSLTAGNLHLYSAANIAPFMTDIQPDVWVQILGTNDYRIGLDSPSQYTSYLSELVAAVRSTSPNTGFVFVAPGDSNATPANASYPLSAYRDALYAFCIANGHEFYNMNEDWASYSVMNGLGMWSDTLHVNDDGAYMLAKRLYTRLLAL